MSAAVRAVIMAFDDVLAHTGDVRADAIVQAAAQHHIVLDPALVARAVTGHALPEIVHTLLANEPTALRDPTVVELIALAAARATTQIMAQGGGSSVHIDAAARDACAQYVAQGARVMLRVDSTRRDLNVLLQLAALDELPLVAICADDRLDGAAGERIADRAWLTIDRRLTALGIVRTERHAIESTTAEAIIANTYCGATDVWRVSQ